MRAVPTKFANHIKTVLHNCFVAPLRQRELAHVYASAFFASVGFALFEVYLSFAIAGKGLVPLLSFLVTRYALSCFVGMPLGFLTLARFGAQKAFATMLAILATVVLFVFMTMGLDLPSWGYGAIGSFITVPFWVAYHTAMVMHTHNDNRGYEVVLGDAGLKIGTVAGSLLGGFALMMQGSFSGHSVVVAAVLLSVGGTAILARKLMAEKFVAVPSTQKPPSIADVIMGQSQRSVLTVLNIAVYNFTFTLAPVWLKVLGLGGMAVGLVNGLSIFLIVLLAPLVGGMANKRDGRELSMGGLISLLGWIPWAAFSSPFLLFASYVAWSAGSQMSGLGLVCRWYEVRSVHALAAREILLGVGRIVSIVTMVPILYVSFDHFVWAAILTSAVMTASAILGRKAEEAAPVPVPVTTVMQNEQQQ